jgi:CRP-like cAMP-binding protein
MTTKEATMDTPTLMPTALFNPPALDAGSLAALAPLARDRRFDAGQTVLRRGATATSLWLVGHGRVALGTRGATGLMQQRRSVTEGQWLDLASGLLGAPHAEDALAESASLLWEVPLAALHRVARSHHALMAELAAALAAEVHGLIDGTRDLVLKDVPARCATWLLEHAQFDAPNGEARTGVLKLEQRKRAVALELGTTAETFSRTLRQLNRQGLIEVRGYSIALLDVPSLRRLAEPAAA